MRPSIEAHTLTLTVRLADGVRVNGDAERLRQVIGNLLSNALKFTPTAGRITVELPIVPPADDRDGEAIAATEIRTPGRDALAGMRIAIIDDDTDTRHLPATMLGAQGAHVTAIGSVREALAALRHGRPDVVVCDLAMPGDDGFALIREVRSWPSDQGGAVPALALTAYAGVADRDRALAAGFQAHLSKPVEPQRLTLPGPPGVRGGPVAPRGDASGPRRRGGAAAHPDVRAHRVWRAGASDASPRGRRDRPRMTVRRSRRRSPPRGQARTAKAARGPARNRPETERAILGAVGTILATRGYAELGVNAIARIARVDKVLIYRYYGGLPQLLRAYGESGSFWPSVEEIVGPEPAALRALPTAERFAIFFAGFVDALRARPLTIEILALETVEQNELTRVLEAVREDWGRDVGAALGVLESGDPAALSALAILVVAGAQYLLVRSRRTRIFGGIDIASDAGWDLLKSTVRTVARHGV